MTLFSVHALADRLLKGTGRAHETSKAIRPSWIWGELFRRGTQLVRGTLLLRQPVFLGSGTRLLGRSGLSLARGVSIGSRNLIDARGSRGLVMGPGSRLGHNGIVTTTSRLTLLGVGLSLGKASGIGDNFHIGCSGGVTFGDNVIVGPYLLVHSQEHNYADPDVPIRDQGTTQREVVVGDDCWIGSRVTLLSGTKLGPRTVVAAGSVVRGEHPGGVLLAGTPAKVIRQI
ncbi:acyltransferase [Frigoribacterium sp. VKM Ac-2836]|uniref:acyltransferase n=1 Tax=Frigoribacterium sp. VKM Ac-2836 TaxID=2739014 RepID=UPI00156490F3|nr:acyltransferase [Frigoribacterium sp. VKM Ac-2836]NRD27273.1 acyltransferase [Frigoribacterium sp. VKM Ac-2836]